jgi:hypothetical protein
LRTVKSETKRGRPRKNGVQPPSMFGRSLRAIEEYNQARRLGVKHSVAVSEVASDLAISDSEVRHVLADFQAKGDPVALIVRKTTEPKLIPPEFCEELGIPKGSQMNNGFIFGFGPRPQYPRINAKNPEECSPPAEK